MISHEAVEDAAQQTQDVARIKPTAVLDMPTYFARNVIVHTHIAKTGGTSFVEGLYKIVGKKHLHDVREKVPAPSEMPREQLRQIWVLSGHFLFDTQERPIARRKRYFLNVRDPVGRFISFYNYVVHSPSHPGHNKFGILDIEGAFDYLKENTPQVISNTICRMFGDRSPKGAPNEPGKVLRPKRLVTFEEALEKMEPNYVLVVPMKRVDDAIRGLADVFGVELPSVERHNVGVKKVTEVSDRVREELLAMNVEDNKLIAHYEALFDAHLKDLANRLEN
jgi:hypothetical protein